MVGLFSVLVLDSHGIISGILLRQVSDRQCTIGPVSPPFQKRLKKAIFRSDLCFFDPFILDIFRRNLELQGVLDHL